MKIKKINRKKLIIISVIIVIIVIAWLVYKSDRIMSFVIENELPGARTIYNELGRLEQDFNPFIALKYNLRRLRKSDIPAFYVKLSGNDTRFFENVEEKVARGGDYIAPELKKWRTAEMTYNGKKYDIEIRIRGMAKEHAERSKKSYKIKIINDENINGMTSFNLILPEDRHYYLSTLSYYLAEKLQMKVSVPENNFVNLFFNNYIQGIYFFSEDMNRKFLENHGLQSSSIFETNDELIYSALSPKDRNEIEAYNNDQKDDYLLKSKDAQYFSEFLQALEKRDLSQIYEMIDIDETAKFAAIATLFQDTHMLGANVKYYLDGTTGKIFPMIWDLIPSKIIEPSLELDRQLLGIRSGVLNEIVSPFLLNPQFLQLRNKYLYQLVNSDWIGDYINEASKKYDSLFMMDTNGFNSYRRTKYLLNEDKELIFDNVATIKDILKFSEIYVTSRYDVDYIDIDVDVHSLSQIVFNAIKFNNVESIKPGARLIIDSFDGKKINIFINQSGSSFSIPVNNLLVYPCLNDSFGSEYPRLRISVFGVEFNAPSEDNIRLEMMNDISGISLNQEEIKYNITAYYKKALVLDEKNLRKLGINYSLKDNHLVIYPGVYFFQDTYKLPENISAIIERGTTIFLGPGVSLIFKDSLFINGSAARPVNIKNQISGKSFGSFAVIGQPDSIVSISFLNVSGGSEDYVDGAYISGAFSAYHLNKATIKNSGFYNSSSDDGLNIKYSQVLLENNIFKDNYVDQVDLDFCDGVVANNKFIGPQLKNDNGDGLDISGSFVLIENNLFDGLGDKGISIGERSEAYVIGSIISDNNLGSAVKDNSIGYFYNNQWLDNGKDLSAYQKKAIFGGGIIILDDKSPISESDVELDQKSKVEKRQIDEVIKKAHDEFSSYR